jgi:hypothetical protein
MVRINHLKKIVAISEKLDSLGLYYYANAADYLLKKIAEAPYDIPLYPEDKIKPTFLSSKPKEQKELVPYVKWKKSLSEKDDYVTEQIPFNWGKYSGKYKPQTYYISSDKASDYLGEVQIPGDPFTYDLIGDMIKVVSAPHDKRGLIGRSFSKKEIPEKYLPKESKQMTQSKESGSQQVFAPNYVSNDLYLAEEKRKGLLELISVFPKEKEQIKRLSRYSGIRSFLNEMRVQYPDWSRLEKEQIETMDSKLMALDLLEYLNLHPMIDDYFIDELPEAINFLQEEGKLLE